MLTRGPMRLGADEVATLFAPVAACDVLGLAVSGGVDSLALMILAARWVEDLPKPPQLVVYTLDHGLRTAAKAETDFVRQCAQSLGLKVRVLRWEGEKPETGLQAAARGARYQLIGAAMGEDGAQILLTGHHLQDQAETVLMRLAHGSGLSGLGGMRSFSSVEGVQVFRPLLGLGRQVLEAEVAAQGFVPVADPSNVDVAYERVRWRGIADQLAGLGLDAAALARFARRAARADSALREMAAEGFARASRIDAFGGVILDIDIVNNMSAEIQLRMVQTALRIAGGDVKPFALQQIEALALELVSADTFAPVTLLGCAISVGKGQIMFVREAARVPQEPVEVPPGHSMVWDNRFEIVNSGSGVIEVVSGAALTKKQAADYLGRDDFRAVQMQGAPLVRAADGAILALGTRCDDSPVLVRFIGRDTVLGGGETLVGPFSGGTC